VDFATGYTSARYTKDSPPGCSPGGVPCKASNGDAISGQAAIDYAPGVNPPFTVALGLEYGFKLAEREAFARADWEYQSRNPWPAALQDPRNVAQYNPNTYTLASTTFTSARAGVYLGDWQLALFVDNVFDSHRVTNYALGQGDPYNPAGSPTVQQNQYIYRPRTVGLNASWHPGAGR
jgi:iron complex outermembrane receptor protein